MASQHRREDGSRHKLRKQLILNPEGDVFQEKDSVATRWRDTRTELRHDGQIIGNSEKLGMKGLPQRRTREVNEGSGQDLRERKRSYKMEVAEYELSVRKEGVRGKRKMIKASGPLYKTTHCGLEMFELAHQGRIA